MNWIEQTFEVNRGNQNNIPAMEGLRGLAVLLVFLVHYSGQVLPYLAQNGFTGQIAVLVNEVGNSGVDLFFILSGYLIYGTLITKSTRFSKYFYRRLRRIYPTFLFVFAIYLMLSVAFPSENRLPDEPLKLTVYLLENILLLPGFFDIEPVITVAWSLSYELFFYLLAPLVIAVFGLRSRNRRTRILFLSLISIFGFVYFYFYYGHVRLLMFVAGMILFETTRDKNVIFPRFVGLLSLIAALFLISLISLTGLKIWWTALTLFILFTPLCFENIVSVEGSAKLFSWTPLRWLGNISYSYYLIHGLTLKAAFMLLKHVYPPNVSNSAMFWLLLIPMFALTFAVSTILFIVVEKPFSLSPNEKTMKLA